MTTPLWCLLAAVLLPYVWSSSAIVARQKQFGKVDNKGPRAQQAKLEGWGARACDAQLNAWEALAVFAPAVLVAHATGADPVWSARLALAWVGFRLVHGVVYMANVDKARSAMFSGAFACAIGLFLLAGRVF